MVATDFSLKSTFYCSLWQAFAVGQSTRISRVSRLGLEMLRLLAEDSESDSDSIFQYTQSRTRNRNLSPKVQQGRKCQYLWLFGGQNENQTRNSETLGSGLGIGLEIPTFKVSDSESGLEKQDSGETLQSTVAYICNSERIRMISQTDKKSFSI